MAGKTYEIAFNLAAKLGNSFSSSFTGASQKLSVLQTNCKSLRAEMKELDAAQKKGAISTAEWTGKYEKLTAQLYRTEQLQNRVARASAWQNKAKNVSSNSKTALQTSAAAGAVLAAPTAVAVSFDTEMAYVAKQVDGARDATGKLTEIGQQAKTDIQTISRDMKIMPDEVARAYAMSARFGVKGMDNLQKMTEIGIMMGKSFEMPAEQVATDMAKIGNALGYNLQTAEGIAKLEALADKINYVDDQTVATGADIINFMNSTAGTIKGLAPTMSEGMTIGLGGGLLAAGERAEVAGTAINAMLTKFAAAPTEAKGFQEALEQIGMSAELLQAGVIKDADGAILDLFNRINQLDQASRNNVLAELIGKEHIDTVSKLTGNYDKFLESIKMANSEAAKGSMRKEFEIMSATAKRSIDGVQASLARTAATFGEALLPDLNEKSQSLSGLIEKLGLFAREHPQLTSALMTGAAALVGFAVAASAVTWVLSSAAAPLIQFGRWMFLARVATDGAVISSRASVIASKAATLATNGWAAAQWLINAAMSANPIGLAIAGIAALVGIVYLLYQNFDIVRNAIDSAWAMFQSTFPNAAALLQRIGDKVAWLAGKIKGLFGGNEEMSVSVGASSAGVASNATGGIYGKGSFLTTFAEKSGEAAIPIDGSARSLSLWQKTGELLGAPRGGSTISASFSPTINMGNGSSVADVQQVLERERDKFRRMLEDMTAESRRLNYA